MLAIAALVVPPASAAVTIGSGAVVNFADAAVNLGCSDLVVAGQASATSAVISAVANLSITGGTFTPASAQLSLGGSFNNAGTFLSGASRIGIVDACGNGISAVSGATAFYDLFVRTAAGKQLVFAASATQSVSHALGLQGTAGHLLQVVSSVAGQQALINVTPGASQAIAFIDARDNRASGATIAPGAATTYSSVDGGNLVNWFANARVDSNGALVPAPLLDVNARAVLLGLLALVAWVALRRRSAESSSESPAWPD